MDVLNSSFRIGFLNNDENYLCALAGALVSSDYFSGCDVYVFKDGGDGACGVRIQTATDCSPEKREAIVLADLRFNVSFDKNEQLVDSDYIYIRIYDMHGNRMFVSYLVDDEAKFDNLAFWIKGAMERFGRIVDCDRVCE